MTTQGTKTYIDDLISFSQKPHEVSTIMKFIL